MQVQTVNEDGSPIKGERPRWHSTPPDRDTRVVGPPERVLQSGRDGVLPDQPEAPAAPHSYTYEIQVSGKWYPVSVYFATREEAEKAGHAKFSAWIQAEDSRTIEADQPVNYRWDEDAHEIKSVEPPAAPASAPPRAKTAEEKLIDAAAQALKELKEGPQFEREEIGPHGPIARQFYHDARGAIAWLKEHQTGEAIAALYHPAVGDIDPIWGIPGSNPRKGYGLSKLFKWHGKEGVLDDLQKLLSSMRAEPDDPEKWNANTIQLENNTHVMVLRRDWQGTPREPWVLTAYLDKKKAALSAGRTIDIPGTREEDWPSPPPGSSASSSNIAPKKGEVNPEEEPPQFEREPGYSASMQGTLADLGIDKASLKRLSTLGAKHMVVDKVTSYPAWADKMNADLGNAPDPARRDRILRTAYKYARSAAAQFGVQVSPLPLEATPRNWRRRIPI